MPAYDGRRGPLGRARVRRGTAIFHADGGLIDSAWDARQLRLLRAKHHCRRGGGPRSNWRQALGHAQAVPVAKRRRPGGLVRAPRAGVKPRLLKQIRKLGQGLCIFSLKIAHWA